MEITSTWVEVSSTSAVLQRHGPYPVVLAYSDGAPTTDDNNFTLPDNSPSFFPAATGESIWARSGIWSSRLSVKEIS